MKTTKKGITSLVLVPLMLLSMSAVAQSEKEFTLLGFTVEDMKMGGIIAAGVIAIMFLAFFTTSKGKAKTTSTGTAAKKAVHHHHHHRTHKLRR